MSSISTGGQTLRTGAPSAGGITPKSILIAPAIPNMTVLEAMLVVSGFLVAAAVISQFSPSTRGRYYEEISP
jgi:MFS transporter, putative metabolite:H+ symporter